MVCPRNTAHMNHHHKMKVWSSHPGSAETNLTSIHEDAGSIPGLAQCVGDKTKKKNEDIINKTSYAGPRRWMECHRKDVNSSNLHIKWKHTGRRFCFIFFNGVGLLNDTIHYNSCVLTRSYKETLQLQKTRTWRPLFLIVMSH